MKTYQTKDFDFQLPNELIAQMPTAKRSDSRLLRVLPEGEQWLTMANFVDCVQAGDLLIFNDTKVLPARLFGQKSTGGKVECLLERVLGEDLALMHVKSNKALKIGAELLFEQAVAVTIEDRQGALFVCRFDRPVIDALETYGHMPLPPYIERGDADADLERVDKDRYQTLWAKNEGAVAAPTAGLHFDDDLLQALKDKGVKTAYVTLHVGAGTFKPVQVDNIQDHVMHFEWCDLPAETADLINQTKADGGHVIAVGTTSVRTLETTAANTQGTLVQPFCGETNLFITPGYTYQIVDRLLTNFHLPQSTLLMLVAAYVGFDRLHDLYRLAIEKNMRFFSYGDAMYCDLNQNRSDHS